MDVRIILVPCFAAALLSGCAGTGAVSALGGGSLPGQVLGLPAATSAQLVNAEIADISSIVQALQALKALLDGVVLAPIPVTPMPTPAPVNPPPIPPPAPVPVPGVRR